MLVDTQMYYLIYFSQIREVEIHVAPDLQLGKLRLIEFKGTDLIRWLPFLGQLPLCKASSLLEPMECRIQKEGGRKVGRWKLSVAHLGRIPQRSILRV